MRKYVKRSKTSDAYLAWMTRPNLSAEQEAELSGLSLNEMVALRQALEDAKGGEEYDKASDAYIKVLSIPLTDAAAPFGVPPDRLVKLVRLGWVDAFKHRNRWRIWLFEFRVLMDSGYLQALPDKLRTKPQLPWLCW